MSREAVTSSEEKSGSRMMVVVPWQQQEEHTRSEMGGKLEKRRALWEKRIREEVTSFTLHREAGREIRSHMVDQDLKLRKAVI